jgi:hypothetical protein
MNNTYSSNKKKKLFFMIPCGIILALLFVWGVQLLWNILMPEIFGLKMISFWQAFGILLLSKILFGGFRFKGRRHEMCHGQCFNKHAQHCTDDDRSKFKAEWKRRFSAACRDKPHDEQTEQQ